MKELANIATQYIINDSTRTAIWHAARQWTEILCQTNGFRVYDRTTAGYYAILGSTLGAMIMRMLEENKEELHYRIVEKVIVLRCANENDQDSARTMDSGYTIVQTGATTQSSSSF